MDNPPLETISQSEYWSITGPAGVSSSIELTLDGTSDVAAGVSDLDLLRIVYWNGSEWEVAGTDAKLQEMPIVVQFQQQETLPLMVMSSTSPLALLRWWR